MQILKGFRNSKPSPYVLGVLLNDELTPAEKKILVAVHVGLNKSTWGQKLDISKDHIRKCLVRLRKKGYLGPCRPGFRGTVKVVSQPGAKCPQVARRGPAQKVVKIKESQLVKYSKNTHSRVDAVCISISSNLLSLNKIRSEKKMSPENSDLQTVREIIDDLNNKTGKHFKATSEATKKMIRTRLKEGYTKEDFFTVHSNQVKVWKGNGRFDQYLRPETLYRPSHFESYLNNTTTAQVSTGMARTASDLSGKIPKPNYKLMDPKIRALKEKMQK